MFVNKKILTGTTIVEGMNAIMNMSPAKNKT